MYQELTIVRGSRRVVAFRNNQSDKWDAQLYVSNGETATPTCGKFKTESGLRKWADKKLERN